MEKVFILYKMNPFFTSTSQKSIAIGVRLEPFLTLYAFITLVLFTIIILSSCVYTFDCREFLPTISYLASYPFYDRFIVFTLTCSVVPLFVFFFASFAVYKPYLNRFDSTSLLAISILFVLALPGVVIIDEVSSSAYLPLERVHCIVLASVTGILCIWLIFSLEWLYKMYKKTGDTNIKYVVSYLCICFLSLIISYWQWKISDTADTYMRLAMSEYTCIVLFALLPKVYSVVLSEVNISLNRVKFNN